MIFIYAIAFAFLNRARGTRLFNMTGSTVIGRIVSTMSMALIVSLQSIPSTINMVETFFAVFAGLMLWATPHWDSYWSAAIGNDPTHGREWGVDMMGLRGLLIMPTFIALAFLGHQEGWWIGMLGIFQGIPYLLAGIPKNKGYAIPIAEYSWGACMGLMFYFTVGL